jgi:hypothetical protein
MGEFSRGPGAIPPWALRQDLYVPLGTASERPELLPPQLVAGNRFGSVGFGFGLTGLLCSLIAFLDVFGLLLSLAGVLLSGVGYVKYCQGGATNRDTSVVGALVAWSGLVILVAKFSTELQVTVWPY